MQWRLPRFIVGSMRKSPGLIQLRETHTLCVPTFQWQTNNRISAKKYSVRAEWLRRSGRTPSEPSETPWWRITLRPASIQCVTFYITLRSLFHCFFVFCRSPILNDHSGIVANCDYTSAWVHWVHPCIGIAIWWVTLRKSLLGFLLPACKMQFSFDKLYTSFQVARDMWLLTILYSFHPSPVLQLVAISGITCGQLRMFPTLKTCNATATGAFSPVQISRRDPSYPSFQVLWWAPGLSSIQWNLHPRLGVWLWIVVSAATRDAHSVHHNTSTCVALPTPRRSVDPLHTSSGFLFIDTSEICVD